MLLWLTLSQWRFHQNHSSKVARRDKPLRTVDPSIHRMTPTSLARDWMTEGCRGWRVSEKRKRIWTITDMKQLSLLLSRTTSLKSQKWSWDRLLWMMLWETISLLKTQLIREHWHPNQWNLIRKLIMTYLPLWSLGNPENVSIDWLFLLFSFHLELKKIQKIQRNVREWIVRR